MKNMPDHKGMIKTLLTNLSTTGVNVKFIRSDDSGKNMTMKNDPEIKSFGINFEVYGLEILNGMGRLKENSKRLMEESG
jgi:hypothetical protein